MTMIDNIKRIKYAEAKYMKGQEVLVKYIRKTYPAYLIDIELTKDRKALYVLSYKKKGYMNFRVSRIYKKEE